MVEDVLVLSEGSSILPQSRVLILVVVEDVLVQKLKARLADMLDGS